MIHSRFNSPSFYSSFSFLRFHLLSPQSVRDAVFVLLSQSILLKIIWFFSTSKLFVMCKLLSPNSISVSPIYPRRFCAKLFYFRKRNTSDNGLNEVGGVVPYLLNAHDDISTDHAHQMLHFSSAITFHKKMTLYLDQTSPCSTGPRQEAR